MTSPKSWHSNLAEVPPPSDRKDSAGLKFPPPLIFVVTTTLGALMHRLWPVHARPEGWGGLGAVFGVFALLLLGWSGRLFGRHKTAIEPWRPTTTLVTTGPYAHTRNPIYLSLALVQIAFGLWFDALAIVLMVIPAVAATNNWVIAKEEQYLERTFGDAYREYLGRVRRWL